MAHYIKVTPDVAKALGVQELRNKTADGNYLLWQADLSRFEESTLVERASRVGGVILDIYMAKAETAGVEEPFTVYTPAEFKTEVKEEEVNNELG